LILHQLRDLEPEQTEGEAFQFAGALLLPRDAALEVIQQPVILHELAMVKAKFGISIAALILRCRQLGLIDKDRETSLWKQLSARGWRKNEPVDVPREQPQLVRQSVESVMGSTKPMLLHHEFGLPPMAIRDLLD
jgi:Zn-dependent peptidase ImmA (M78 family)